MTMMRSSTGPSISFILLTIPHVFAYTASVSTVLPTSLIDVTPSCSVLCLEYFVILNYPPSTNTQDIDCLCSTNTTTGLTIGEGALQCAVSDCPPSNIDLRAYTICSGRPYALSNTHKTLTISGMAASATVSESSPLSSSVSSIPSVILPPSTPSPSISNSEIGLASDTGTPTTPSPSSSTTPSTSAFASASANDSSTPQVASLPSPTSTRSLSTSQIVGIVVAGVASAAIVFGALLFIYCLRRKRRLKRQSDSLPFHIEKPLPHNPPPLTSSGQRAFGLNISGENIAVSNSNRVLQTPAGEPERRRSFWWRSVKPEDIGVAVSPETPHDSPESRVSSRTLSKLLPEKPNYSLFPAPLRISRQPTRPNSTTTVIEDDGLARRSYMPPTIAVQDQEPDHGPSWPTQLYDSSSDQTAEPTDSATYNEQGVARNQPINGLPIHPEDSRNLAGADQFPQPPRVAPLQSQPIPLRLDVSVPGTHRAPSSTYSDDCSLPTSDPRGSTMSPIRRERQPSIRDSHASETEFEIDEEETPPEEKEPVRSLSPVEESPIKQSSPLSTLRYPRIPRPASMSKNATYVPKPLRVGRGVYEDPFVNEDQGTTGGRQPRSRQRQEPPPFRAQLSSNSSREDSPSSLLAKRRGDQAAGIIERGLRIRPDVNTPASRQWKVVKKEPVRTPPSALGSGSGAGRRTSHRGRRVGTTPPLNRENSDEVYGTPKGRGDRAAKIYEEALKSPTWEPKLTPTRRGNDLFLSVERG